MKLSRIMVGQKYNALTPHALSGVVWTIAASICTYLVFTADNGGVTGSMMAMPMVLFLVFAGLAFLRHFQSGREKFIVLSLYDDRIDEPDALYAHVRFANGEHGDVKLGKNDPMKSKLRFSSKGELEIRRSLSEFPTIMKAALMASTLGIIGGLAINDFGLIFVAAASYLPSLYELRWQAVPNMNSVAEQKLDS